jgi:5-methylcytosine-specific restriction endonuclease McrA
LGKSNPYYKHGKTIINNCIDCNIKISYQGLRCHSCSKKGRLNPQYGKRGKLNLNWKGGRTKIENIIYISLKYNNWRKKILFRDNYKCKICNSKKQLEVHHKIPLAHIVELYSIKTYNQALKCKLLWDIIWGITLCQKCHAKTKK